MHAPPYRLLILALLPLLVGAQTLHLQNRDQLTGRPLSYQSGALRWYADSLAQDVTLRDQQLATITYPAVDHTPSPAPTGQHPGQHQLLVTMHRGDTYVGQIQSLSADDITLQTQWAGTITIQRQLVSKIKPLHTTPNLLTDLDTLASWAPIPNRKKWRANSQGLTSQGRAAMSKETGFPTSFHFRSQVGISGTPRLKLLFMASEGTNYEPNDYIELSIQRSSLVAKTKVKGSLEVLGQKNGIQELYERSENTVDLFCSLPAQRLICYLNGRLMAEWVLPDGIEPHPWFLVFADYDGDTQLTAPKLQAWNGILPYSLQPLAPIISADQHAIIYLNNGDTIDAADLRYHQQDLRATTTLGDISLPVAEVAVIDFSGMPYQEAKREQGDITLMLHNGSIVTMKLLSWQDGILTGESQNFGTIQVREGALAQVRFNIYD